VAKYDYDLVIIGAGPGWIRSRDSGTTAGFVGGRHRKGRPGWRMSQLGCIPSKALIHQAEIAHYAEDLTKMGASVDMAGLDYSKVHQKSRDAAGKLSKGVQSLLKKNKVEYIPGTGSFVGPHEVDVDGKRVVTGAQIMIATGSRPREIPGFEFDGKKILSSTDILSLTKLPKKLVILGAGAIGMEFAYVMKRLWRGGDGGRDAGPDPPAGGCRRGGRDCQGVQAIRDQDAHRNQSEERRHQGQGNQADN
jgi:dihydrolipoamide dehydrogenase